MAPLIKRERHLSGGIAALVSSGLSCFAIIASLSIVGVVVICDADTRALIIEGKSFSLRSTVTAHQINGSSYLSRVQELYSAEQKRAHIGFRLQRRSLSARSAPPSGRKPSAGAFYMDHERRMAVMVDGESLECKESDVDELNRLFYRRNPLPVERVADDYIIGPARLLFYITKHRDKMTLSNLNTVKLVRNLPVFVYELAGQTDIEKGVNVRFVVSYSRRSISQERDEALPIQIVIHYERARDPSQVTIDYSHFQLLQSNTVAETSVQFAVVDGGGGASGITLDPFILPPGFGCSGALASKAGELLFANRSASTSFSFKTESKFENDSPEPTRSFVAFDSRLESLRVDRLAPPGRSGTRRQVFNFRLNRMYHEMERVEGSSRAVDKVLDTTGDIDWRSTQCMLARLQPRLPFFEPDYHQPYTIGQVLAGADKFVYLGRAQVRGIEARVYEAQGGAMPYWLDQPVVYSLPPKKGSSSGDGDQQQLRDPLKGARLNAPDWSLTVLLYFADKDADHPLLHMELHKMKGHNLAGYARQTICVHDFVWHLTQAPSNGDPPRELFSLEDVCSSSGPGGGPSANHYAQVRMLVESARPATAMDQASLAVTDQRDLALLASLQDDIHLPATMIYDLESRLVKGPKLRPGALPAPDEHHNDLPLVISLTFRVAQHPIGLVELYYLGQGTQNVNFRGKKLKVLARSFQECFLLAAHRRTNVYFGFDMRTRICYLDLDNLPNPSRLDEEPQLFVMEEHGSVECFRSNHTEERELSNELLWIERTSRSSDTLKFLSGRLELFGLSSEIESGFILKIREFHIDETNRKGASWVEGADDNNNNNNNRRHTDDIDRLAGFGLLENGAGNRRIRAIPMINPWTTREPKQEDDRAGDDNDNDDGGSASDSMMTFEQCQAACLSDLECRAYSVCVRHSEVQCVITNSSFTLTVKFVELLEESRRVGNSGGGEGPKFGVWDDDGQFVELARHPNCQLYRKNFLSLFLQREPELLTLNRRHIRPVRSQAECAEMCLERNLNFLRLDLRREARLAAIVKSSAVSNETEVEKVLAERNSALAGRCQSFHYLGRDQIGDDHERLEEIESQIKRSLVNTGSPEASHTVEADQVEGYCSLGRLSSSVDDEKPPTKDVEKVAAQAASLQHYEFERHSFKSELLYEKQYGVRLLKSPFVIENEENAYIQEKWGVRKPNGEQYRIFVRKLVEQNENNQLDLGLRAAECAERCFFHGQDAPVPACRSFEVLVEVDNFSIVTCRLNTLTLRQAVAANRLDLIERVDPNTGNEQLYGRSRLLVWHYDPRPGLAMEESIFSGGEFALAEAEYGRQSWFNQSMDRGTPCMGNVSTFGLLFILILATSSGLIAGVKLGHLLIAKSWLGERAQDQHIIIESITGLELDDTEHGDHQEIP